MEMLDQPTAPAKETSLGEERWTLECGNVTIVTAPGYEDLEPSDNWQVTLPHCPPLCRRMKPCGNIFEAAGPPHCAVPSGQPSTSHCSYAAATSTRRVVLVSAGSSASATSIQPRRPLNSTSRSSSKL